MTDFRAFLISARLVQSDKRMTLARALSRHQAILYSARIELDNSEEQYRSLHVRS